MAMLLLVCSAHASPTTTDLTTVTEAETTTVLTTADQDTSTTTLIDMETTTPVPSEGDSKPFRISVPPMNVQHDLVDWDLQDIGAEESETVAVRLPVAVTSFVADSATATDMDVSEAAADVRERSGSGADLISAFFVAPEDEVMANCLDRRRAQDRGDGLRYNQKYGNQNSLSNEVLAPLQAAVSLSHEKSQEGQELVIEKQTLKEMPVYKTTIEIQKSIPYEIKGNQMEPVKEQQQNQQQEYSEDAIAPPASAPIMFAFQIPPYRSPVFYKYPTAMYYVPQSYIGNYIMRHSHENTGALPAYFFRPRSYYYLRYPSSGGSLYPQTLPYQVTYSPAYASQSLNSVQKIPQVYQNIRQFPSSSLPELRNIPGAYQDTKGISASILSDDKDYKDFPLPYSDLPASFANGKFSVNQYDKDVEGAYKTGQDSPKIGEQTFPSSSYQDNPGNAVAEEESKPLSNGRNIPLNYHTLKVIPAAYGDMKGNQAGYPELGYLDDYREDDQNGLHSEQVAKVARPPHPNLVEQPRSKAPFRPSQHVFSSVYPPHTYRVPLLLATKGRGIHARSVKNKELCVEYGGFKPPMVPSVQIHEEELPKHAEKKSDVVEEEKKEP